MRNHEAYSKTDYESFWSLGKPADDFSRLVYLGAHGSDSSLTSLISFDPFNDPNVQPVDWTEFVLTTMDTVESDGDTLEEYPLFKFFGRIPDEGTEAAVFGLPSSTDRSIYDGIVIRSLDSATPPR